MAARSSPLWRVCSRIWRVTIFSPSTSRSTVSTRAFRWSNSSRVTSVGIVGAPPESLQAHFNSIELFAYRRLSALLDCDQPLFDWVGRRVGIPDQLLEFRARPGVGAVDTLLFAIGNELRIL